MSFATSNVGCGTSQIHFDFSLQNTTFSDFIPLYFTDFITIQIQSYIIKESSWKISHYLRLEEQI